MLLSLFIVENERFNFSSICIKIHLSHHKSTSVHPLWEHTYFFHVITFHVYTYTVFLICLNRPGEEQLKSSSKKGEKKSKSPGSFLSYHVNVTVTDISTKQSL